MNIVLDEKSYEVIFIYIICILHITFVKNGYINDYNGNTYLLLISINENNVDGTKKYLIKLNIILRLKTEFRMIMMVNI